MTNDAGTLRRVKPPVDVSVVIPIHDERDNLAPLLHALDTALPATGRTWEIVLVDDGSTDGSGEMLDHLAAHRQDLVVVHLRRCFGQTAALEAGIHASHGSVLVFLDADLQNDPEDIPLLVDRLDAGYDVVHGWRRMRQDRFWTRRLPSLLANWLIRRVTGVMVSDLGCAIRALRRDIAEELPLEGEMHRFIAVLADARGARWTEVPVRHHPRRQGQSKYGLSRTFKVAIDLVTLCWFTRLAMPMTRVLVGLGVVLMVSAPLPTAVAAIRSIAGQAASWPASLGLTAAAMVAGVNFIGLGIIASTSVSTWWRSRDMRPWSARSGGVAGDAHRRRAA